MLALLLVQSAGGCTVTAGALMARAEALVTTLDMAAGLAAYEEAAAAGCSRAVVAAAYLRGWQAAREAYREGGSESSLVPVRRAQALLEAAAGQGSDAAAVGQYVLLAAAAAAQSEREDLGLFIEHAMQLERRQVLAGALERLPITAHEAAGDLWLRVHRFDSAREAFERAAALDGASPRAAHGLATSAVRLKDRAAACESYRRLVALLGDAAPTHSEAAEARAYLAAERCPE